MDDADFDQRGGLAEAVSVRLVQYEGSLQSGEGVVVARAPALTVADDAQAVSGNPLRAGHLGLAQGVAGHPGGAINVAPIHVHARDPFDEARLVGAIAPATGLFESLLVDLDCRRVALLPYQGFFTGFNIAREGLCRRVLARGRTERDQ